MDSNRRQYFRVEANYRPLEGTLVIEKMNGEDYKAQPAYILIADISAGGVRFVSSRWFPVNPNVLFRFHTKIDGLPFNFEGELVWSKKIRNGVFEYGLKFSGLDSKMTSKVILSLNHMVLSMRKASVRLSETLFTDKPELVKLFDHMLTSRGPLVE